MVTVRGPLGHPTLMPARVIWKKFLWRGIPVLGSEPSWCLRIVARLTVGLL